MWVVRYPVSWYNVTENDVWLFLYEVDEPDVTRRSKLSCGYYDDPLTLMYHINKGLHRLWSEKTRAQMSYSSVTQKMTLHTTPNTVFITPIHSSITSMLGFRTPTIIEREAEEVTSSSVDDVHPSDSSYPFHIEADDVVNMTQGFNTLYVYTDIVESRIVGDTLAPLLRTLPISGRHGDILSDRFTNIHYVPLLRSTFHTIEMDIRDDMGRRVPFEYGRMVRFIFVDARPDCSDELQRLLRATGWRCAALLRRCAIPARSRTGQSVRRSIAQCHAARQERCLGFGQGSVEDRRSHSRRRLIRSEHKNGRQATRHRCRAERSSGPW